MDPGYQVINVQAPTFILPTFDSTIDAMGLSRYQTMSQYFSVIFYKLLRHCLVLSKSHCVECEIKKLLLLVSLSPCSLSVIRQSVRWQSLPGQLLTGNIFSNRTVFHMAIYLHQGRFFEQGSLFQKVQSTPLTDRMQSFIILISVIRNVILYYPLTEEGFSLNSLFSSQSFQ